MFTFKNVGQGMHFVSERVRATQAFVAIALMGLAMPAFANPTQDATSFINNLIGHLASIPGLLFVLGAIGGSYLTLKGGWGLYQANDETSQSRVTGMSAGWSLGVGILLIGLSFVIGIGMGTMFGDGESAPNLQDLSEFQYSN